MTERLSLKIVKAINSPLNFKGHRSIFKEFLQSWQSLSKISFRKIRSQSYDRDLQRQRFKFLQRHW
jgi:hypothetical protein